MSQIIFKATFIPRFTRQFFYKSFNRLIFWSAGVNFGRKFKVYNRVYLKLYNGAKITIGNDFTLTSGESINPISRNTKACIFCNNGAKLSIGNNVGMSSPCIWCNLNIEIQNNVKLGGGVIILDTDCHSLNYINRYEGGIVDENNTQNRPIIIEENVMIGANSIILKGIRIGARSIIGAGSVVTNNIPPDSIAGGNPCKVIKKNE